MGVFTWEEPRQLGPEGCQRNWMGILSEKKRPTTFVGDSIHLRNRSEKGGEEEKAVPRGEKKKLINSTTMGKRRRKMHKCSDEAVERKEELKTSRNSGKRGRLSWEEFRTKDIKKAQW